MGTGTNGNADTGTNLISGIHTRSSLAIASTLIRPRRLVPDLQENLRFLRRVRGRRIVFDLLL